MGIKEKILIIREVKKRSKQMLESVERIFPKIDDEMYMLSKSVSGGKKEQDEAQRVLAIFIMAELMDSFEVEDQKKILKSLSESVE